MSISLPAAINTVVTLLPRTKLQLRFTEPLDRDTIASCLATLVAGAEGLTTCRALTDALAALVGSVQPQPSHNRGSSLSRREIDARISFRP